MRRSGVDRGRSLDALRLPPPRTVRRHDQAARDAVGGLRAGPRPHHVQAGVEARGRARGGEHVVVFEVDRGSVDRDHGVPGGQALHGAAVARRSLPASGTCGTVVE